MRALLCTLSLTILALVTPALAQCTDADSDGYYYEAGCGTAEDCNDASPATFPGATELCEGYDNDCNGLIDDDAACDPTCGYPDLPLDAELRITDRTGEQTEANLVWTGSGFGLAWQEYVGGEDRILFARLDSDGTMLGGELLVTDGSSHSRLPSLAWNGSEYGVAWNDDRDGNREIYFARISSSGVKVGGDVRVTNDPAYSDDSSLVWSGAEWALAWLDGRNGYGEIYFTRLTSDGVKIGSDIRVSNDPESSLLPSLVWTGSQYGVAWFDGRDPDGEIYFRRLDAAGTPLGLETRVSETPDRSKGPSLAWNGSEFAVAWHDERGSGTDIYLARMDASGAKIGSDISIVDTLYSAYEPSLVWTGSEYALAWQDLRAGAGNYEIYFARLTAAGVKLGEDVRASYHAQSSVDPSLVWTGSRPVAAFVDYSHGAQEIYLTELQCDCVDSDTDGTTVCRDCDDANDTVYPGAEDICDGLNNDCQHPSWPDIDDTNETDDDSDALSECAGDCDDNNGAIFPGNEEICDGLNNDCDSIYWPGLPPNEVDGDWDGFTPCDGDCDDVRDWSYPGATEICDYRDNDCDLLVDEDTLGEDVDSDGVHAVCDNCPITPNTDQSDPDSDGFGSACDNCPEHFDPDLTDSDTDGPGDLCDNCPIIPNTDQADLDSDDIGDLCDNCPQDPNFDQQDGDEDTVGDVCDNCEAISNTDQADGDSDGVGTVCDNCPEDFDPDLTDSDTDGPGDVCDNCAFDRNPGQEDLDTDGEGDPCDLDDGMIYIRFFQADYVEWQPEVGYSFWNCYRGDLAVLKSTGVYTQLPGSNDLAHRECGLFNPLFDDPDPSGPWYAAYFLTTGIDGGAESGLGQDWQGNDRFNHNPCP